MALPLSSFEFENAHERFQFIGRYSYAGGTDISKRFHTGRRYTKRVLNHTNAIEIWKSEDGVIIFSWTEYEYEQRLVYMLDAETDDDDEDWSVLAVMDDENSLRIRWKLRTGEASQAVRFEFTDERLTISTIDEILDALVVNFKKIDGPKSDFLLRKIIINDIALKLWWKKTKIVRRNITDYN